MCTIFKVFIELVTILLLFNVLVFWPRRVWDLCSPTRDGTCQPLPWKVKAQPPDHQGRPHFNHFKLQFQWQEGLLTYCATILAICFQVFFFFFSVGIQRGKMLTF